jgi:hypothetical protein
MRSTPAFVQSAALFAAISCLTAPAFAQSAATDPVGFISVNVDAGSVASPKLSLVSPTLVRPVEWQGAATVSGTTITVTGTPWTAGQFGTGGQYFVEVATGTTPGAWTDIESNATNSLTTSDNLSAFAGANATVRIRKHTKLTDFVGVSNSAGLQGGTSASAADEVLVYDGSSATVYFYYTGAAPAPGWYDLSFNSAANVTIAPHQGVVIRRKTGSAVNFTAMGSVKTGNTLFPIQSGVNVVGTVSAKGLTLATSGLYTGSTTTGVQGGTSASTADEVTIFTPTGPTIYFYYTGAAPAPGWYDLSFNPAGTVSIPPGAAVVVKRKAPGVAFNWTVPSPSSF